MRGLALTLLDAAVGLRRAAVHRPWERAELNRLASLCTQSAVRVGVAREALDAARAALPGTGVDSESWDPAAAR